MKRLIILTIATCVLFTCGYLVYRIFTKLEIKKDRENLVQILNPLKIICLDGKERWIQKSTGITLFFFFNSDCHHCHEEAKLIRKKSDLLKKSTIYFLSTEPLYLIRSFAAEYHFEKISNISFGQIGTRDAFEKFNVHTFPMIYIYSKDGSLLQQYKGEVKIEAITKYL